VVTCLAAAAVAAPVGAATVEGTWRGTVRVVSGDRGSFAVLMRIDRLRVGERSGTLRNPGTPCRGTLRLTGRRNGGYAFRYRERSRSSDCTGDDRIFVRLRGSRLSWQATSPDGRQVARGTLRRR
jgi:hypothetical protein